MSPTNIFHGRRSYSTDTSAYRGPRDTIFSYRNAYDLQKDAHYHVSPVQSSCFTRHASQLVIPRVFCSLHRHSTSCGQYIHTAISDRFPLTSVPPFISLQIHHQPSCILLSSRCSPYHRVDHP